MPASMARRTSGDSVPAITARASASDGDQSNAGDSPRVSFIDLATSSGVAPSAGESNDPVVSVTYPSFTAIGHACISTAAEPRGPADVSDGTQRMSPLAILSSHCDMSYPSPEVGKRWIAGLTGSP